MNFVKKNIFLILDIYKKYYQNILLTIGVLITIGHFAGQVGFIAQNADIQQIIFSKDNDAGRAIITGQRTAWYKSNHFTPYGNLYFRIAHTMESFSSHLMTEQSLSKSESKEKSMHFYLMLTSLIAIYALSIFLAFLISSDITISTLLTPVVASALLKSQSWVEFILRTHPDILLGLSISFATYFFYRFLQFPKSNKYLVQSAFFWGIATAIKSFTAVFGLPLAIFILHETRSIKKLGCYILLIFISYQIIGLPQNLDIVDTVHFLFKNSKLTGPPDIHSLKDWFSLFNEQLWWSLPIIAILTLMFGEKGKAVKLNYAHRKILIFSLIAPMILFTGKHHIQHNHYPIPFVASLLTSIVLFIRPYAIKFMVGSKMIKLFLSFLILISLGHTDFFSSKAFSDQLEKQFECRDEARRVRLKLLPYASNKHFLLTDPYFPSPSGFQDKVNRYQTWGLDLSLIKKNNASVLGLRRGYFSRFYSPPTRGKSDEVRAKWGKIRAFYTLFDKNQSVTDKFNNRWKKIHDDSCGFIIWIKE